MKGDFKWFKWGKICIRQSSFASFSYIFVNSSLFIWTVDIHPVCPLLRLGNNQAKSKAFGKGHVTTDEVERDEKSGWVNEIKKGGGKEVMYNSSVCSLSNLDTVRISITIYIYIYIYIYILVCLYISIDQSVHISLSIFISLSLFPFYWLDIFFL